MGIEFRIDSDEGTVYTTFKGDLGIDEIMDGLAGIVSHEDFRPGMRGIFDLIASKWESTPEDLRRIVRFMLDNGEKIGVARCAVVVGSERSYGMTRMLEVFSAETSVEVRVFRDYGRAERWMNEGSGEA